jgi:hypothetical protein
VSSILYLVLEFPSFLGVDPIPVLWSYYTMSWWTFGLFYFLAYLNNNAMNTVYKFLGGLVFTYLEYISCGDERPHFLFYMILYFCVFLKGFTPFLNCPSFKNYLKFLK